MKKEKQKKMRRPAQHVNRSLKGAEPASLNNSQQIKQTAQQSSTSQQRPFKQQIPPVRRRPSPSSNPRLFDQSVQPIPSQFTKKQGMAQTILPISAPASPQEGYNDGQAQEKRRRKPQKAEKRLTRGEARRRRFRKKLLTFIILTLVIVAGITLSMTFLFKIEKFEIDGTSTYSAQDLETAFGVDIGENIFSFDLNDVEKKMSAALPYAETVTVRRRLPSTIVFKTTQADESYYTDNPDGGYAVLSAQLKILRLSAEPVQDLPFISGAQALLPKAGYMLESAQEGKLEEIKAALTAIAAEGLIPFSNLDVTNILEISFVYDKRAKVILGTSNELESKLALAGIILRENIGQYEKGVLDVSHKSADKDRQGIWRPGSLE